MKGREPRPYRALSAPFVVAPPGGCRIRTRLHLSPADEEVLRAVGEHLGALAGADLAARVQVGNVPAAHNRRAERKKALTAQSSSRWAGAITRTSEDQYQLARRALNARIGSLRQAIATITARLAVTPGSRERRGRRWVRGYTDGAERRAKQQRLQILQGELRRAVRERDSGRVRITRGGRRLLNARHHLYDTATVPKPLTAADWQAQREGWDEEWSARRMFVTADGEAGAPFGNYTLGIDPADGSIAMALPDPLRQAYANAPRGRYVLDAAAAFTHRGEAWADRIAAGASVRYDITYDPARGRWYLDASWSTTAKGQKASVPALETLRQHPVLAVDLNADHLAAWIIDPHGNPIGTPHTIPLQMSGVPATTRDARLRAAISDLLHLAQLHECAALVIENLDFADARATGREKLGRGRRGKAFRRTVAGIPTGKFRDRLSGMAHHAGLSVIAIDPTYTSRWGTQHWLNPLKKQTSTASTTTVTAHHAAAVVVGRRGLGCTARRRKDGPRQTPATTASRRTEAGAVRPEDRTGTTAPQPPSHRSTGRTERTAPARTSRSTPVVRQTRARPPGKHPPHGPTTVRGPSIHDQLTLFGMPDTANLGQST
ncbi:hypothetical protein [Streptomyces sp. DSM 40750]|uniref:hypothetical protein n=1 Tax=Streptomyces sp. DSM 40750 TaxID=2801030 RepID=UPI00214CC086|nr:hypothetical protein [Streptomyces sp. DSM 40750]UUU22034.1 hypothetical protein JIX55_17895 [Streptomyces sp. DSM 40750]